MKTILFLDRAPLTELYAKMTPHMNGVKCIHVAYSQKDVDILSSYGIKPDYVYLDLFKNEYDQATYDNQLLQSIDNEIIVNTNGRFNLNGAIQSDRGFTLLSYDECLRSVVAHYNVWNGIFKDNQVDLILHEPCSLFFNFLGCVLCKQQGGAFSYQVASLSDSYEYSYQNVINDDFTYPELQYLFNKYLSNKALVDVERCNRFLEKFRKEQGTFLGGILNRRVSIFKLCIGAIKHKAISIRKKKSTSKIYNNIGYWQLTFNKSWEKLKNVLGYRFNKIKFESKIPDDEKFFFYPFHLEPEAVVMYLGDGIYKNQTKLIENIAASLPAGFYLYVKDHPHEYAYRDSIDYKRLMQVPNIRLFNQWISAKAIMSKAQGVITINGTAGFEAALLNKQVYCFGHNMYSFLSRVNYISNIRDLKPAIYNNINKQYTDDDELRAYVMAYLNSCHPGYTDCYSGGVFIDDFDYEENAKTISANTLGFVNQKYMQ